MSTNMEKPMDNTLTQRDREEIAAREKAHEEADARIKEILAKHQSEKRFEITPQMRREADIKALQDGDSVK